MRILFALAGLHRVSRGAEIAFTAVADRLARRGHQVTLMGSGEPIGGTGYRIMRAPLIPRERFERFPKLPALRNETAWEEASFLPGFLRQYRPQDFDVTLTCAYPFLNWALRARTHRGRRPAHVFVTQNGDWPARAGNSEYRFFGCDGLVCINPDYLEANQRAYRSRLIPNGVDLARFHPGPPERSSLGLPDDVPLVLMVSALIPSKFVQLGIEAVAKLPGVHLAVAGDGPERASIAAAADAAMPGRFHNFSVPAERMPALYRSASIFLHLSRDESFGNVFVEAMASGLRTVAWDLPRTRWITGDTALLVPEGDVSQLSQALSRVLSEPTDRETIALRAQQFSWDKIAIEYEDFLAEVVECRSRTETA